MIRQIIWRIPLLEQFQERYKLEERARPAVEKSNRNCIWFGGEKCSEVDIVAVAIIVLDLNSEVGQSIDAVLFFAPVRC